MGKKNRPPPPLPPPLPTPFGGGQAPEACVKESSHPELAKHCEWPGQSFLNGHYVKMTKKLIAGDQVI